MSYAYHENIDNIEEEFFDIYEFGFVNVDKLPDNLNECKQLIKIGIENSNIDVVNISKTVNYLEIVESNIGILNLNKNLKELIMNCDYHIEVNIPEDNNVETVALNLNGDYFPLFLQKFKNLKSLNVAGFATEIPEWLGDFNHLQELDLSFAGTFTTIPESVKNLNLETFNIELKHEDSCLLEISV